MKNLSELFKKHDGKGAIGAFNVHCLEMLPAMIEGANEVKVPIIIQTSLGTAEYIGFDLLVSSVEILSKRYNVDVCLHMDHCSDMDAIKRAIDAGYSSVMYDGSSLPLEKNIENTKLVVEYAHNRNVSVEGEVGIIGGAEEDVVVKEDEVAYTNPNEAYKFVNETGVDALAVAIGTTHGQFKTKANINFELLREISSNIGETGLVLHGGTGVSDEDLNRCATEGMKKVNVGSELNKGYIVEVNKTFPSALSAPLTSLRGLLKPANDQIKEIVKEKSLLIQI